MSPSAESESDTAPGHATGVPYVTEEVPTVTADDLTEEQIDRLENYNLYVNFDKAIIRGVQVDASANLFPDKIESYAEIYENLDQVTNFDIEYLKQLNCCTTLLDLKHMEPIETEMRTKYDYYFRKPIKIEEIQKFFNSYNSLTSDLEVFPYFIDESNNNQYKCIFINIESMRDNLQKIGKAHLIPVINSFLTTIPTQADAEIKEKLISINSNWEKAINIFRKENAD